ncbi:RARS [Lepeophtheirus salmonis]|uniref:Probable arginine--tRNA ligase, mitochondrial n=1 Tax=Lepeophtheirus salmonis TaxID=72036 RepID=A0A7R8D6K4_LEPSM|nr:RARS [Lepeophtheirus salmonis]CAF3045651.1 RARS [Lepeophtheirus salmonis]
MRWVRCLLSATGLSLSPSTSWDWDWDARQKNSPSKATRYLLLVRHGQYDFSNGKLTPKGWEQAFATARRLKELNLPLQVVVALLPTNELLREGAPYPDIPKRSSWKPPLSYHVDGARIEAAFRNYFHRAPPEQKKDSYEIIVCHANVIRYFVCRALQLPPEAWLRLSLKHASLSIICIRPDGRISLRALGDSGHLPPNLLTDSGVSRILRSLKYINPIVLKIRLFATQVMSSFYRNVVFEGLSKTFSSSPLRCSSDPRHFFISRMKFVKCPSTIELKTFLLTSILLDSKLICEILSKPDTKDDWVNNNDSFFSPLNSSPKRIIVEFSSPNIAKPFHYGHLRSTIIGNYVANINEVLGHSVTRINFLGDWGNQFGLLAAELEKKGHRSNKRALTDESFVLQAKECFRKLEKGDESLLNQWKHIREITVSELAQVYRRLGNQKGLLNRGELLSFNDGLGKAIPLCKSDGSSLYVLRDVGAAMDRAEKFHFDKMYYVVENGQSLHFQNLFRILNALNPYLNVEHIKFGRIHDEAKQLAMELQDLSINTRLNSHEEKEHAADISIRKKSDTFQYNHCRLYRLLTEQNIVSNTEELLLDENLFLNEHDAVSLVHQLALFDEVLKDSHSCLQPYILVKYMQNLCEAISKAFRTLSIKNAESHAIARSRVLLFFAAKRTLKMGMKILGIQPLSKIDFFKNGWENYYYYEKGWADDAYYDKWTPAILEGTIPQLGSVIDLTATHKYYRPYELKYATHFKIKVPGRVIPPEDILRESKPDKLIGVHCTHGVNRTGYFLCRYLIDKMDWSAEKAISEVGQSRGYEIERDCFLNGLRPSNKECTINKPTCNLKDNKPPKYSADYPAKKKNKKKSKIIVGREATKVLELKKIKEHAETPKIKDLMGASLNLNLGGMDIVTKDDFRQIERALIRKINTFAVITTTSSFIPSQHRLTNGLVANCRHGKVVNREDLQTTKGCVLHIRLIVIDGTAGAYRGHV